MSPPRRILLAQTSFLGDVVLTTALARLIRESLPDAEVWWLVRPEALPLVAPLVGVDRALAFDKRGRDRGWSGLLGASRRLRAHAFSVALGVQRSLRTAALLALAGIPLRIGYAGSAGSALYHRRVTRSGSHARDRLIELARGLSIELPQSLPDPELRIDPENALRAAERLAGAGVDRDDRLLVLAPGSAWATKRWPARRFAEAARQLVPGWTDRVAVIGSAGDRALGREIAAELADSGLRDVIDWTGEIELGQAVAMIGRAALVLANDSAPAHIAAALGRPVVALFGPTTPAQGFAPLGDAVRIVERDLDCRPCSRHGGDRCPIGTHECLSDLPVELVVKAARALLEASRHRHASAALLDAR
jgi:heptosyltransferase-2